MSTSELLYALLILALVAVMFVLFWTDISTLCARLAAEEVDAGGADPRGTVGVDIPRVTILARSRPYDREEDVVRSAGDVA